MHHTRMVHSNHPNFEIQCPISFCPSKYKSYHSLYKHVNKRHKTEYGESNGSICGVIRDDDHIARPNQSPNAIDEDIHLIRCEENELNEVQLCSDENIGTEINGDRQEEESDLEDELIETQNTVRFIKHKLYHRRGGAF